MKVKIKVNIENKGENESECVYEGLRSFEKMNREGTTRPLRNIPLIEQPLLKFEIF